ncbi:MAG: hypothetical protein PUE86_06345 [Prevotella sp.]|nr:hypothetical protein [Prevotella sp.]
MRRLLYISLMFALCIIDAAAQQSNRRLKMPVPGVGIRQMYGNSHQLDAPKQKPLRMRQSMPNRCNIRIVKPGQQTTAPRKAEQMVNKTLLTGWEEVYENLYPDVYTNRQTGVVTYDKYGHFQTVDYGDYKQVYDYEYGIDGKWTKKTVSRVENESTRIESKEERTLDAEGRVLAIRCYEGIDDTENYNLVLTEEKEYDYAHDPKGVLVKHVEYDEWEPTRVEEILIRKWFAPLQAYVEYENHYNSSFVELTVEETTYIVKTYSYNYDTKAYDELSSINEYYFTSDGREAGWYRAAEYNEDGSFGSQEGVKYLYTDNAPQAGYTTKVTQEIGTAWGYENWTYTTKEEYSNNYDEPLIPGSGNRYKKEYSYDTDTQSWTLVEAVSKEWTAQGYLKETNHKYYNEEGDYNEFADVEIWMYDGNGENIGYVYEFSDGGYVLEQDEWNGSNNSETDYYTYYDKNGNVTRQLKVVANDERTSATMGDLATYELKNGTWTIVTGVIKIGDAAGHIEAEFDNKGRVIRGDEYNADNQLAERSLYTYTDNGYTEEQYELLDDKLYKTQVSGISIDANGTLSDWYINYNIYGDAMSGYKDETYANGKHVDYYYDTVTGQFVYSGTYVNPSENVAPDGTVTTIYRELDADGNVVETSKVVRKSTDGYSLYEVYDKKDGKWVGIEKREDFLVDQPYFPVNPIPDPLECHDEYFFPEDDDDVLSLVRMYHNTYVWLNDAWSLLYGASQTYALEGNTLTSTYTRTENNPEYGRSYKYTDIIVETCDDNRNLVSQTCYYETVGTEGEEKSYHASKREFSYEYNSEQLLTSVHYCDYMDETGNGLVQYSRSTTNYIYSPIEIVGINPASATGKAAFRLNGRTLVATAGTLSVYAPDGTLVAEGQQPTLSTPGIYIVVAGNSRSKIIVR